jgi:hypothetical protein
MTTVADLARAGAVVLLGSRHPAIEEAELLEQQPDAR